MIEMTWMLMKIPTNVLKENIHLDSDKVTLMSFTLLKDVDVLRQL